MTEIIFKVTKLLRFKCEVPCTRETEVAGQQSRDVAPSLEALEKEVVAQPKRPPIRPGRKGINGKKAQKQKRKNKKGAKKRNGKGNCRNTTMHSVLLTLRCLGCMTYFIYCFSLQI